MNPAPHQKRASVTGFVVLALVVTLLAGAVLVRLVGDETPADPIGAAAGSSDPSNRLPGAGRPAPDFTLLDLEDQPVSLSDWRGQPVLVNFWATWCAPCEVEMPTIQAAYEVHQRDGLVVLAVAVDDSTKNVRRFFEKHGLTFQPLMDDGEVSRAYQVFGLPTSFFVGVDGQIVAVHTGVLTGRDIEEYLAWVSDE